MDALLGTVLSGRRPITLLLALITLLLGMAASRIRINRNPEELAFRDDPDYPRLTRFFERFGHDELLVAAYTATDVLAPEALGAVESITDALAAIPGVDRVVSLSNARDVRAEDGELRRVPLVDHAPRTRAEREALRRRIAAHPVYGGLLVSRDGRAALFDITLRPDLDEGGREATLRAIRSALARPAGEGAVHLAGAPYGRAEMFGAIRRDARTLYPVSFCFLVAAMALVFRSLAMTLLPLAVVGTGVVWTVGIMELAGGELDFLSILVPTIMVTIGTSDCIHFLGFYCEALRDGQGRGPSLARTLRAMLLPCLLTTVTTMAGFASLRASPLGPVQHFGLYAAVGIACVFVLSFTMLPIGLSWWGDGRRTGPREPRSMTLERLLLRLHAFVARRRGRLLVLASLLAGAGALGVTGLHVETDLARFFGERARCVRDTAFMEAAAGGLVPIYVVVDTGVEDGVKEPALLARIDALVAFLRRQEGVDRVLWLGDLLGYADAQLRGEADGPSPGPATRRAVAETLLLLSLGDEADLLGRLVDDDRSSTVVCIRYLPHDFQRLGTFRDRVSSWIDEHFRDRPRVEAHVTGTAVLCANTLPPILEGLERGLFLALGLIFVLMVLVFRSWMLGLISMVPNLLPICLTLGAMGLLGIPLNIGTAPVASVALGLAVDDTIHYLVRFRRELARDGDPDKAVERAIVTTGRPILITSLVLAAGFSVLVLSGFQPTRNLGVLIGLTMISALVADLIVLPALLLWARPVARRRAARAGSRAQPAGIPKTESILSNRVDSPSDFST